MTKLAIVGLLSALSISISTTAAAQESTHSTSEQVLSQRLLSEISSGLQWQIRATNAEQELQRYKDDDSCKLNKPPEKKEKNK